MILVSGAKQNHKSAAGVGWRPFLTRVNLMAVATAVMTFGGIGLDGANAAAASRKQTKSPPQPLPAQALLKAFGGSACPQGSQLAIDLQPQALVINLPQLEDRGAPGSKNKRRSRRTQRLFCQVTWQVTAPPGQTLVILGAHGDLASSGSRQSAPPAPKPIPQIQLSLSQYLQPPAAGAAQDQLLITPDRVGTTAWQLKHKAPFTLPCGYQGVINTKLSFLARGHEAGAEPWSVAKPILVDLRWQQCP